MKLIEKRLEMLYHREAELYKKNYVLFPKKILLFKQEIYQLKTNLVIDSPTNQEESNIRFAIMTIEHEIESLNEQLAIFSKKSDQIIKQIEELETKYINAKSYIIE
jgi:alkyl hydroperoxide reductase subunit AhpF